jgi:hypothetical protein
MTLRRCQCFAACIPWACIVWSSFRFYLWLTSGTFWTEADIQRELGDCYCASAHACNPSFLGGGDREDRCSKPAQGNSSIDYLTKQDWQSGSSGRVPALASVRLSSNPSAKKKPIVPWPSRTELGQPEPSACAHGPWPFLKATGRRSPGLCATKWALGRQLWPCGLFWPSVPALSDLGLHPPYTPGPSTFFFCGTGTWTQRLHLEPLHQPFVCVWEMGFSR